jgi:hypothetical protein
MYQMLRKSWYTHENHDIIIVIFTYKYYKWIAMNDNSPYFPAAILKKIHICNTIKQNVEIQEQNTVKPL